jgi:hypothetical protein
MGITTPPLKKAKKTTRQNARTCFQHAEYDFYTQSVISTHTRVVLTRMHINMTLTSVITTRTSVIYTRRV